MNPLIRWDQAVTTEETNVFVFTLARRLCQRIKSGPIRECFTALIDNSDIYSLCNYRIAYSEPLGTLGTEDAATVRQILALFEKRADLDIGVDRRRTAVDSFIGAETSCRAVNDLFSEVRNGRASFHPRGRETDLWKIAAFVSEVLGPCPSLESLRPRFGPGATTQIPKRIASTRRKLSQPFACSEDLLPLIKDVLAFFPHMLGEPNQPPSPVRVSENGDNLYDPLDIAWTLAGFKTYAYSYLEMDNGDDEDDFMHDYEEQVEHYVEERKRLDRMKEEYDTWTVPVEVHTGKLAFVPKNAKTDRTVVVEPWLNGVIQLAIGDYMANRLLLSGMSVRDQTRNRVLAKRGSIDGSLATIDLSSASDTISTWLIRDILPPDWFELLNAARTSQLTVDGVTFRQEKFSSMGNGFTFPLETLLFWAIAQCASGEDLVSVYGDDIIVETQHYEAVVELLSFLGFSPNLAKSFATGPFRESCGADFLRGIDIRPCYLKQALTGQDLFRLHNHFVRSDDAELAHSCLTRIHQSLKIWGPDGYGDGHLIGGLASLKPYNRRWGWSGYVFDSYVFVGARDFRITSGDKLLPLYLAYQSEQTVGIPLKEGRRYTDLQEYAKDFRSLSPSSVVYDRGALGVSIPGVVGYKIVSIYTFTKD